MSTTSYPSNTAPRLFLPQSADAIEIREAIDQISNQVHDLSLVISGNKVTGSGEQIPLYLPHRKTQQYATVTLPNEAEIKAALADSLAVRESWASTSVADRAAIFNRVADLIEFKYKNLLVAATMVGQSKTVFQGEIDAAAGLIDAIRFNSKFALEIENMQPPESELTNIIMDYRPLEGFVYSITPFNFTTTSAILSTAPALMGNVVIWKPSITAMLPAQLLMDIYKEAGLPDGVINLVPGYGPEVSKVLLANEYLAGIYFTGSTKVFRQLWKEVGDNLDRYRNFPRLVGETGGKGFVLAHPTANRDQLISALVRSAYEYQGQKCSACSRAYISQSVWNDISEKLISTVSNLKVGPIEDFSNFMGAVIDKASFDRLSKVLNSVSIDPKINILAGGKTSDELGYFVEPTLLLVTDATSEVFATEYFGPILAINVFPDDQYDTILNTLDQTSPYALTGSIFCESEAVIESSLAKLRNAAGSINVNDKPTGAVMGKHPFGGSRASGTNDKAGSLQGLLRWTSPRVVRTVTNSTTDVLHPHQGS
jgi:1-pyrroline-5-carboxylate dehydrogenase